MKRQKQSVELTSKEIEVIEGALQTQEKILAVQDRAGAGRETHAQLATVKTVLKTLAGKRKASDRVRCSQQMPSWLGMTKSIFS